MTIGVFYIFTLELNFKLNYQSQFALCCTCSFLKSLLVLIQLKSHFSGSLSWPLEPSRLKKKLKIVCTLLKVFCCCWNSRQTANSCDAWRFKRRARSLYFPFQHFSVVLCCSAVQCLHIQLWVAQFVATTTNMSSWECETERDCVYKSVKTGERLRLTARWSEVKWSPVVVRWWALCVFDYPLFLVFGNT